MSCGVVSRCGNALARVGVQFGVLERWAWWCYCGACVQVVVFQARGVYPFLRLSLLDRMAMETRFFAAILAVCTSSGVKESPTSRTPGQPSDPTSMGKI